MVKTRKDSKKETEPEPSVDLLDQYNDYGEKINQQIDELMEKITVDGDGYGEE